MPAIRPIHYSNFERFLKEIGCHLVRQEGDHRVWVRADLIRPIIVRAKKDLPIMEIKSNLRTLGMSNQEYLNILDQV
jgi:predicted RNA binding protein YcfA (HicA-like mRNA interferase family)